MPTKRTTIYLPAEIHRALRRCASEQSTTLSELVLRAVRTLLSGAELPDRVAEHAPSYGGQDEEGSRPAARPQGLLAAVGALEGIEGAEELAAILSTVRENAREREVAPLAEGEEA
jgi:hypothetical protein